MIWVLRQAVRGVWSKKSGLEEIEQDLDLNYTKSLYAPKTKLKNTYARYSMRSSQPDRTVRAEGPLDHGLGTGSLCSDSVLGLVAS